MRIAIVGCGYIADHYVQSARSYPALRFTGVYDKNPETAARFAARYGLPVYESLDELLDDRRVEMVLNLTNPRAHYEISRASLEAGKHVYSEKPLATHFEQARELVELAEARGLQISGAPCSLLGECAQTLWKAVRQEAVGKIRVAYAEMDDGLVHRMPFEKWKSASGAPWPFRDEFEVGCTLEHAGYALTWLLAFFGPARSVTSLSSVQIPHKHASVPPERVAPDLTIATIPFANGVVGRLTCSILAPEDHSLRLVGDEGVLHTPDVWRYDAPVTSRRWMTIRRKMLLTPWSKRHQRVAERGRTPGHDDRSRGVNELAAAIAEGRESRLSGRFCLHVTELTLAIQNAGPEGNTQVMTTGFDPIAPMPWAR